MRTRTSSRLFYTTQRQLSRRWLVALPVLALLLTPLLPLSSPPVLSATSSYANAVLADNPVLYYRLGDPVGSSTVTNLGSLGSAEVGTVHGGAQLGVPGLISGDPDTALAVDGSTGYVSLPSPGSSVPPITAFSLEAWFETPVGWTGTGYVGSVVGVPAGFGISGGSVFGSVVGTDNLPHQVTGAASISDGKPHYLVFSDDGTHFTLYLDGAIVATAAATPVAYNGSQAGAIGSNGNTGFFEGTIDEVAVYTYALTGAQVLNHYRASSPVGITLTPATQTEPPGATITAIATVTNASGNTVQGVPVSFSVMAGPDTGATGHSVTDIQGGATFSFTNNGMSGVDSIQGQFVDASGTIHTSNTALAGIVGAPQHLTATPFNGAVSVSWQPPLSKGSSPVTGYVITATADYNDRIPAPDAPDVVEHVSATTLVGEMGGLVEDCHQTYVVTVAAETAAGAGPSSAWGPFRPSGIVAPGKDPPYVVILLDGVAESQPGFTMNPYTPTLDGNPSYCPESWYPSTGTEDEADFARTPSGPWSFFHKWNFGEVDNPLVGISNGNPSDHNPDGTTPNTESVPRARVGNGQGILAGRYTHSFMLDAIAARGAIILPFSYQGSLISKYSKSNPEFTFYGYSRCQSLPGCGPTIQRDADALDAEVISAAAQWPTSEIVVMGHSQGGLIAFQWWLCSQAEKKVLKAGNCGDLRTTLPPYFLRAVSLDSPINGACGQVKGRGPCFGPPSYPGYDERQKDDPLYLLTDAMQSEQFRFIGTYGDSPLEGYQSGAQTLEHQMLFPYSDTLSSSDVQSDCANPSNETGCPAPAPPNHISECPVNQTAPWETPHYVEKYCPGDVAYFNNAFGLSY